MANNQTIISKAFESLSKQLLHYVYIRINNREEAEDIVQDVFLRLLGYNIISEGTIKCLCYTIANNLVIDHIRRHYKKQEIYSYIYDMTEKVTKLTPEQLAAFHDIVEKERCIMLKLSPATQKVYKMTRIDGLSIDEIAEELNISRRTVECHQQKGRKTVRMELRKII